MIGTSSLHVNTHTHIHDWTQNDSPCLKMEHLDRKPPKDGQPKSHMNTHTHIHDWTQDDSPCLNMEHLDRKPPKDGTSPGMHASCHTTCIYCIYHGLSISSSHPWLITLHQFTLTFHTPCNFLSHMVNECPRTSEPPVPEEKPWLVGSAGLNNYADTKSSNPT
jgi:hypothetical protein